MSKQVFYGWLLGLGVGVCCAMTLARFLPHEPTFVMVASAACGLICSQLGILAKWSYERCEMTDSDTLTAARLAKLAKAATPGPWTVRDSLWYGTWVVDGPQGFDQHLGRDELYIYLDSPDDAAFIAACGTHRARLVRALRLLEAIESVRERGVPNSDVAAAVLDRLDDAEGAER